MTKELNKIRFARVYRFIRLQQRVKLNIAFDDDVWANDLLNFESNQKFEEFDKNLARRAFKSRFSSSVSGNIHIRLAKHKLLKSLLGASHPVDRAVRKQLDVHLRYSPDSDRI